MKRLITIVLLLFFINNSFSQVKLLKEAEKAYFTKKWKKMPGFLQQVEKNSFDDLKPYQLLQFYFFNGMFLANINPTNMGQQKKSIGFFEKSQKLMKETKNYAYSKEIKAEMRKVSNNIRSTAVLKTKNKEYASSAGLFNFLYDKNKKDTVALYNAALNFYNAEKSQQAIGKFNQLIKLGYTGKGKQYFATNTKTGTVDLVASKSDLDALISQGRYKDPQVKDKPSLAPIIVATLEKLYTDSGQTDKIESLYKKALNKYPNETQFKQIKANQFFENAIKLTKEGNSASALIEYEKALVINPDFPEANLNIAAILLNKDNDIVKQMNSLTTSPSDKIKYKQLVEDRNTNFNKAIPYLEKYHKLKPENKQIGNTLLTLYKSTKSPKAASFEALLNK